MLDDISRIEQEPDERDAERAPRGRARRNHSRDKEQAVLSRIAENAP